MKDPMLMSVRADYMQDGDDNGSYPASQTLCLEMTHCGDGPYLVVKTERWAIDDVDEISNLLCHFWRHVNPMFDRKAP